MSNEKDWGGTPYNMVYERRLRSMNKTWRIAIPGILALIAAYVVIALLLVKLLWAWTIPDLFPGAVAQDLLAGLAGALAEQGVVTTR
jgi:hypothetical protein